MWEKTKDFDIKYNHKTMHTNRSFFLFSSGHHLNMSMRSEIKCKKEIRRNDILGVAFILYFLVNSIGAEKVREWSFKGENGKESLQVLEISDKRSKANALIVMFTHKP